MSLFRAPSSNPKKYKREIKRILRQAVDLPVELVRNLYFRRRYDRTRKAQIKVTKGRFFDAFSSTGARETAQGQEVGIYLIHPSLGLKQSHLHVLQQMADAGIHPILVSNLTLTKDERQQAKERVAQILERPNIGYDFGGYRDAILSLQDRLPTLKRLWILNDSAWMLPTETNWFEQAKTLEKDFVAATTHYGYERIDPEDNKTVDWRLSSQRHNFHYASYAWCVSSTILRHPGFLNYWKKLEIRNDKRITVKRGEIGFSKWMLKQGFSHAATYEADALDKELSDMSAEDLRHLAKHLMIPGDARAFTAYQHMWNRDAKGEITALAQRKVFIDMILMGVSRQGSAYALPFYMIENKDFPFLKKSPLRLHPHSSQLTTRLIDKLADGIPYDIKSEAQEILAKP